MGELNTNIFDLDITDGEITLNNQSINKNHISFNDNVKKVTIDFDKMKDKELLKLVVWLNKKLEDMIEDKTLIKLPCEIGSPVYHIIRCCEECKCYVTERLYNKDLDFDVTEEEYERCGAKICSYFNNSFSAGYPVCQETVCKNCNLKVEEIPFDLGMLNTKLELNDNLFLSKEEAENKIKELLKKPEKR